jgi:hypothetical protein
MSTFLNIYIYIYIYTDRDPGSPTLPNRPKSPHKSTTFDQSIIDEYFTKDTNSFKSRDSRRPSIEEIRGL